MVVQKKIFETVQMKCADQVRQIVDEADKRNIKLRVLGGAAVMIHCPNQAKLLQDMKREPSDVDFVALASQEQQIEDLFRSLGYMVKGGQGITMEIWSNRRIFEHAFLPHVDVFFDELDFCHKVDFRKRLHIDSPTISLADLILGKVQIVEINEKDLQDVMVLNLEHRLGDHDGPETINARYIAEVLVQDWGFYYTATTNLKKVKQFTKYYRNKVLDMEQLQVVNRQIDELLEWIESTPKTFRWKARSMVGTKMKWYKNPGEEYREVAEG